MKHSLLPVLLLTILFFSCKKNDVPPIDEEKPFILRATAGMSDSSTTSPRLLYTDAGFTASSFFGPGSVSVKWEVGEIIEFCFRQGTTYIRQTTAVSAVNSAGTGASFHIVVPAGIDPAQPYDVYAVTGDRKGGTKNGNYLNTSNPKYVEFYSNYTSEHGSLQDAEIDKCIIQVARNTNVPGNTTSITFKFYHIGSLAAVSIQNTGTNQLRFDDMELWHLDIEWKWSLQDSHYNLETGLVEGNTEFPPKSFFLTFFNSGTTHILDPGQTKTFYQWFIPAVTSISGLTLDFYNLNIGTLSQTASGSEIGTIPLTTGKRYYFNRNYRRATNLLSKP